jgi:hypothetical protein
MTGLYMLRGLKAPQAFYRFPVPENARINDHTKMADAVLERSTEDIPEGARVVTVCDREGAMEGAVRWCIAEGILKGFFETHGTEVVNMLMTEWKLEEALVVEREEGLEEGMEKGREEIAHTLLKKGWGIEETEETVKLDIERVRALSASSEE